MSLPAVLVVSALSVVASRDAPPAGEPADEAGARAEPWMSGYYEFPAWAARVNQITVGMARADAEALLPSNAIPPLVFGSLGRTVERWRVPGAQEWHIVLKFRYKVPPESDPRALQKVVEPPWITKPTIGVTGIDLGLPFLTRELTGQVSGFSPVKIAEHRPAMVQGLEGGATRRRSVDTMTHDSELA